MKKDKIPPVHPGEILFEEFLKPMGISQNRLSLDIMVPPRRINEIVHGKRQITADTALRLGRYFGMSSQPRSSPLPIPSRSKRESRIRRFGW